MAHDCGLLPLALSMAGALAKERPLDPSSWRAVHEKLHEKRTKFRQMENGKLFSTIDTSLCELPLAQRQQLQLMAVMASGALATTEMLANLWAEVLLKMFPTGTTIGGTKSWTCELQLHRWFRWKTEGVPLPLPALRLLPLL